jgi:hypothetical protein
VGQERPAGEPDLVGTPGAQDRAASDGAMEGFTVNHKVVHDLTDPAFPHGTRIGRRRGCTCVPCKRARNLADKKRTIDRQMGTPAHVPIGPVFEHLTRLVAHPDVNASVLARAVSGVSNTTINRILGGSVDTTTPQIETALLALTLDSVLPHAAFNSDAVKVTMQLMRSMQAQGWSLAWQAAQLGRESGVVFDFLNGKNGRITVVNQRKIAALARQVDGKWGPSEIAARQAREAGWYPLAAYDENGDLIPEAVEIDSEETAAAQVMRVLEMAARAVGNERIAAETGLPEGRVRTYRAAAGLHMDKDGKGYKHRDPAQAEKVREVAHSYEWDGWTAVQSLEKLGIKVIERKKRASAA